MELYSWVYAVPYMLFLCYLIGLMAWEFHVLNKGGDLKTIHVATLFGMLVFFGLRGFVSTDWYSYYPYFQEAPPVFSSNFGEYVQSGLFEFGFLLFTSLIKTIFPNYFIWIFICFLIDLLIFHDFVKRYSRYYVISFIAFMIFQGCVIEFNLLRNSKAIFLFIFSLRYIERRSFLSYSIVNLIGFCFHATALFYLPLYFILYRKMTKKTLISIFVLGNILFLFHIKFIASFILMVSSIIGGQISVLAGRYVLYVGELEAYGFTMGYFERCFFFLLLLLCYDRLLNQNKNNILFINSYVIYFIGFFFFSEISVVASRLSLLFIFSYWILYSNLFALIGLKTNKQIILILFICFAFAKIQIANNYFISKYDNVLFGIDTFEERKRVFEQFYED